MKALRLKISDKWSSLKWFERDYFMICLFIYIVVIVTEVLHHLNLFGKFINIIPLILGLFLVLYLFSLPFLVKIFPIKLPFSKVLDSETDWKSFKGLIVLPLWILFLILTTNKNLLTWAPLWLKIGVIFLWLSPFLYGLVFASEKKIENLTDEKAKRLETNQTFNTLAFVFIIIICIIGVLIYYDLHK